MPYTTANDLPDPLAHLIAVELAVRASGSRLRRSATLTAIVVVLIQLGSTDASRAQQATPRSGDQLPPWTLGTLDIHQIVTGRGNAAFSIFPDGTTLLVDAGDAGDTEFAPQRPDASRTPAQWIGRYLRRMLQGTDARLDYAVVTHFHPDHMGRISGTEPVSALGDYRVRGLTELAEELPIARLIDRGWPDYEHLTPAPSDRMFENYRRCVAAQKKARGLTMMRAEPGSGRQVVPVRDAAAASGFSVRIVSANDRVWTGRDEETTVRFPALDSITVAEDRPTENMSSVTLLMRYGHSAISLAATCPDIRCQADRRGTIWRLTSRARSAPPTFTSSTIMGRSRSRIHSGSRRSARAC